MAQDELELLGAKLKDALALSEKRPCFIGFLNEHEIVFCEDRLRLSGSHQVLFFGGHDEAERRLLGVFPPYMEPDEKAFPLLSLTFSYREEDVLSHRDFLGSFMALGVERSVVGDILCGVGQCVVFIRSEMKDYFLLNLRKIGKVGIRVEEGLPTVLPGRAEFEEISGVIASERLDCLVAFLCKTSREKATVLIRGAMVMVNHRENLSSSSRVHAGDIVSVRKKGRFTIDKFGPLTSKGRISVTCRKYK